MRASRLAVAAAFVLAVTLGSGVTESSPALAKQPCTKTVSGNCIKGGHRCAKAKYGKQGWDAAGKSWFCKGSRSQPHWERSRCAKALDRAFRLARSTPLWKLDVGDMDTRCPTHTAVFDDYISAKGRAKQFGRDSCAGLLQDGVHRYAVAYLRQDGYCTSGAARRATSISWHEAGSHIGTNQRVCGPLAGTGRSSDDVFWNLGRNYPDPERFTIVLWDVGSVETPQLGTALCASGRITTYRGVPEIELRSADDVAVSR